MTTLNRYLPHRTPLVFYPNCSVWSESSNVYVINFSKMEVHDRYFPEEYLKFQEKL